MRSHAEGFFPLSLESCISAPALTPSCARTPVVYLRQPTGLTSDLLCEYRLVWLWLSLGAAAESALLALLHLMGLPSFASGEPRGTSAWYEDAWYVIET